MNIKKKVLLGIINILVSALMLAAIIIGIKTENYFLMILFFAISIPIPLLRLLKHI